MITLHHVGGALLAPVLVAQGVRTRRVVPKLPEPPCPRVGVAGAGPEIRLLVLGDSAAAGVGAETQAQALTGRILAGLTDAYTVRWRLEAVTGATTADTLERLAVTERERFDVAVTSLGVNDITSGARRARWLERQDALVRLLRERFSVQRVVLSALPPLHAFPALPQPLRWFLGSRTRYFDRALNDYAARCSDCDHVQPIFSYEASMMASDGFHPGPGVYRVWGAAVAEYIRREFPAGRA